MVETVVIQSAFCGPPRSGNGGYSCGVAACLIEGPTTVNLRAPPPLDTSLTVAREGDTVSLMDGDTLVATARPGAVTITPPAAPPADAVEQAARGYVGFRGHVFPTCFVCGPERDPGDGLRIFAGPVDGHDMVAAPWTPDARLADERGLVRPEILWAALDCPGFFAVVRWPEAAVLGQLTVELRDDLEPGTPCSVIGWSLGKEGRKLRAGTAIYAGERLIAVGEAIWISVDARKAGFI